MPRETSAAIGELFHGFSGYVQADAKSVYDLLFKPAAERPPLDDGEPVLDERHEVGCWSHCRRKAWEVAITSKDPVAREAVLRIKRIFDLDRSWRGKPPDEIRSLRQPKKVPGTLLGPGKLGRVGLESSRGGTNSAGARRGWAAGCEPCLALEVREDLADRDRLEDEGQYPPQLKLRLGRLRRRALCAPAGPNLSPTLTTDQRVDRVHAADRGLAGDAGLPGQGTGDPGTRAY